jgi:maleylacetoacetate isomerase
MKLFDYYRSSASYRVRIALHYKGINCQLEQINLVDNKQHGPDFTSQNPQQLVPLLQDGKIRINQSQAILEYLEEKFPQKPLLSGTAAKKAVIRAFVAEIACDIHPLNNLRVLKYLKNQLNLSEEQNKAWYFEWLGRGFSSLEKRVSNSAFCFGETPSWADCFLIPQIYNARRFDYPMETFPKLDAIYKHCLQQSYFIEASPEERFKGI